MNKSVKYKKIDVRAPCSAELWEWDTRKVSYSHSSQRADSDQNFFSTIFLTVSGQFATTTNSPPLKVKSPSVAIDFFVMCSLSYETCINWKLRWSSVLKKIVISLRRANPEWFSPSDIRLVIFVDVYVYMKLKSNKDVEVAVFCEVYRNGFSVISLLKAAQRMWTWQYSNLWRRFSVCFVWLANRNLTAFLRNKFCLTPLLYDAFF